MNNITIEQAFDHGKAFIPFVTCGDPDLATTAKIVEGMQRAGADLVELGIPFSDPTAEGPVIQEANLRALSAGTTTDKVFDMVADLRKTVTIPLVFMTYANVIFSYGSDRFMARCAEVGIQGVIVPDVPFEEKVEFASYCKEHGIAQISMIAPTSKDRIRLIASQAEGFLYCVSSLGVTGVRSSITTDIASMVEIAREASNIPCAVGFGISTPQQAHDMAAKSDGAIVGSAIVKKCAEFGPDAPQEIESYVREMKAALN